jgi:SAM-dependent methyltransferase
LRDLPYFRALLRAVEARFYDGLDLPSPTIDIGCGDGHFGELTFDLPLDVGIDPWWKPILEAQKRKVYLNLVCTTSSALPFPTHYFRSGLSNSVLEHIPEIDLVIAEIARILQPGAPFVFCVPNHRFLDNLSIGQFLNRIGLKPLGTAYRNFFNRISRIAHCDSPEVWIERFENHGFRIEENWDYFPPSALRVLEWGHYFGIPSLVSKMLFGRWILVQKTWNLKVTERIVRRHYDQSYRNADGVYTFFIARRIG